MAAPLSCRQHRFLWNWIIGLAVIAQRTSAQTYTDGALFRENFESGDDWNVGLTEVQPYTTGGIDGHILKVSYPPTSNGSPRIGKKFRLSNLTTSATLSFDFKLDSQFEFVKGGKMHGLGGGRLTTGCLPIDPVGWTVRLMWRPNGVPEVYVYHQDRKNRCGDGFRPSNGFQFQRDTWYRVDLQVTMNSAPDQNDGIARLFVNGDKLVDVNTLRLAGYPGVDIERFLLDTFYGGNDPSWSPSKTTFVYYDNFTVSRGQKVTGKQGTTCEIFRQGIYNPGAKTCCSDTCGSCGGKGCGYLLPRGSAHQCCTQRIGRGNNFCESSSSPCKFRR